MRSDPTIEDLRRLRVMQKDFFKTHRRELLEQIRPLEASLLPRLEGLAKSRLIEPDARELYKIGLSMVQHQQAWITARNRLASLERQREASSPESLRNYDNARKKADQLERSCKALERQTDDAIEHYLSPSLPGV